MTNKEVALKFLETCALKDPKAAFAEYVNPNFRHHNQYCPGRPDFIDECHGRSGEVDAE